MPALAEGPVGLTLPVHPDAQVGVVPRREVCGDNCIACAYCTTLRPANRSSNIFLGNVGNLPRLHENGKTTLRPRSLATERNGLEEALGMISRHRRIMKQPLGNKSRDPGRRRHLPQLSALRVPLLRHLHEIAKKLCVSAHTNLVEIESLCAIFGLHRRVLSTGDGK